MSIIKKFAFLISLLGLFIACEQKPEPIKYGDDECELCRMRIMDNKYGAELVTEKGKVYKYDSIECLIGYALNKNLIGEQNHLMLVSDYSKPGELVNARKSFYVHNNNFSSPMGLNVSAFANESGQLKFITENSGEKLNWIEVIELVKQDDF
jgi:copper chaperone NosL